MVSPYIFRAHDEKLLELVRNHATGNHFLVGPPGSGKSAALRQLTDMLIEKGVGFQLIPGLRSRDFLPPFARINVIDDLDAVAMSDGFNSELMTAVRNSAAGSLNIIALRNVHADSFARSLKPGGLIQVHDLTDEQIHSLVAKITDQNNSRIEQPPSALDIFRQQLGQISGWHPFAVDHLLTSAFEVGESQRYRLLSPNEDVSFIKPKLISLGKSVLAKVRSSELIVSELSPRQFEELVAELFVEDGYSVELTQETRDGGVDIFAWRRDVAGEFLTIVQCKKHSAKNPVRVGVIREVVGSLNIHEASAAAIFTTSYFTDPAKKEVERVENRCHGNVILETRV